MVNSWMFAVTKSRLRLRQVARKPHHVWCCMTCTSKICITMRLFFFFLFRGVSIRIAKDACVPCSHTRSLVGRSRACAQGCQSSLRGRLRTKSDRRKQKTRHVHPLFAVHETAAASRMAASVCDPKGEPCPISFSFPHHVTFRRVLIQSASHQKPSVVDA